MADVFNFGGGGSPAGADAADASLDLSLAYPFELTWPLTADSVANLNDALRLLFQYSIGDINTRKLIGRAASGKGKAQEISIGSNLTLSSAGTLSASGGTSALSQASLTISTVQLGTLNSVPLTIVAAPGAGIAIVPLHAAITVVKTVASGGPSPSISTRIEGIAQDNITAMVLDLANAPRTLFNSAVNPNSSMTSATFANMTNKALTVRTTSDSIGSTDAVIQFSVVYYLVTSSYP